MGASRNFSRTCPSLLLLWFLISTCLGQNDPVKNFCRRWGHQSAVVDRRLYIDGGLINYEDATNNLTNTFLSFNDLDAVNSGGMPPFYANLSKNATIPSVNGGILWEDSINKRLYLYGGEYYSTTPQSFDLYSYDILYNKWDSYGSPPDEVQAASYGAGVSISSRGEAYYYGGWLSNASIKGWSGPPRASNGLIKYEMDSNTWSNITGPDDTGRAEGAMVFIPVGDGGMLVYFGGAKDLYGNGTLTPQPLDEIFLFDVANAKWYTQKTSGNTPDNRRRFCGGATWAKDQSSYNIYIYGGGGFPDSAGYDDIYILTIPSFQWIRGPYPTYKKGTGAFPKSMMSCNVIDDAQMLVIGGTYSNATDKVCDVPSIQGAHNMNLGKQNKEDAIWALYQPKLTTYVVPIDIRTAVGGSSAGGATETTPVSGFDAPDLAVQMERTAGSGTRTATRATATGTKKTAPPAQTSNPPSSGLSTGAIAGIAVGCSVVFILALAGCVVLIYRRRKYHGQGRVVAAPPPSNDMATAGTAGWASPVAPSYNGGQMWPAHPPSELTSEHRSPDMHQRMSPKNDFQVTSGGGGVPPAELAGEGNMHEYHEGLSPLSSTSPHNEWANRY
ncbi:hypothetical protein BKA59DRAFT_503984 [Fusarium tricinctum]|uniref:Kelch repeat-containing protein n=1 Tax=Fusarium tricinctum TaxID=61284 RepID=A0A8K0RPF8_9HYPO|nr:hypothetical protein BKA59DRAFT_503984 [Fusarium tricinctum]